MHVGLRRHRHQKSHLVDDFSLMRKNAADPAATFAVLLEFERALHDRAGHRGEAFRFFLGAQFLPVQLLQPWLVIKRVHWTRAAGHEELNHASSFRGMMQPAV